MWCAWPRLGAKKTQDRSPPCISSTQRPPSQVKQKINDIVDKKKKMEEDPDNMITDPGLVDEEDGGSEGDD